MLMTNKTVIVTGGNSGIGKESAIALSKMGAHIVIACRETAYGNEKPVDEVIDEIEHLVPGATLSFIPLDLACLASVRNFVQQFTRQHDQLDILLNNAGVLSMVKKQTSDGFELTMGTNHLGPFLLTNLLLERLTSTPNSRIVNVASKAHAGGKVSFANNTIETRWPYSGLAAYADSKLANIFFTQELAERLSGTTTTVNALHPGGVATNIWPSAKGIIGMIRRRMMKNMSTPEKGARTSVYLCSSPEVQSVTGKYFYKKKQLQPNKKAQNKTIQRQLWQVSAEATGLDD
jgi:NAD(P)-dependent dehydrogenase (short-subunit alcohol dehydrogenase family)